MQAIVINLHSAPQRWLAVRRQFADAGLAPRRHEAVAGHGMPACDVAALYSEAQNRSDYHRPLQPGEIGCYASHLAAWRHLLAGDAAHLAVFEDDVVIEPALGAVLDAVARLRVEWDMVKLIGRGGREKVAARAALADGHDLVSYRRVPSHTSAYVIARSGARKLLARHPPFGRPVDVDLRHWWECGLTVLGVLPYPVREVPGSPTSIDGRDDAHPSLSTRWHKLALQWRYTSDNRRACLARERRACLARDAAPGRLSAMAAAALPLSPLSAAPAPRRHVRNLVVVRAGAQSLHRQWIAAERRDFDLFVSEYAGPPGGWGHGGAEYHELRRGPKWPCLQALLLEHAQALEGYDAIWFPDDDLAVEPATIDRMFAFFHAHALALAQPALTRNSFHTWATLLQDRASLLRFNAFVEVMAPIFSRRALALCAPTFGESESGWGLDWLWPAILVRERVGPIAVIDATPVWHTRPVGGELYRNHPTMDPRADAKRVLRKYGLSEVRALAKYSVLRRVQVRPLPWATRFAFWLKRLNGRRKHRFAR